ncbi:Peptide deformylase [Pediococcus damnosus]|uniref:Peptide deformylase n=1 Tax=Pediococcus damnosus TaxID=51663 RepID=A0A143ADQ2_9LACO|nr:peptide deformylase [Pediococcus damnosus]AMV59819.1 Peptide deformylase [Pediococcus damnosus]AMV61889.1 Peptide deformylase [Pediococcus damnosus]AMV64065.1 Peptide deformylase [Pediococcus damnosus]AMV66236.1 Peptide deformylase [Pediococcus damnosus]AMV68515.1 Peptide deformylase [Pediococcus damnosus]
MIKMNDITRDGDPVLRKRAKKATFPLSAEQKELGNKMMEYLINSQNPEIAEKYKLRAGVGLAAPQAGISLQMAAVLVPGDKDQPPLFKEVLVNPVIISESVQVAALEEGEGCLSVDKEIPGYVPRHDRITIKYQTVDGEDKKIRLKNYPAIVCQHEIDHLKGTLFYDHINKEEPLKIDDDAILIG